MKARFHPAARAELLDALTWYEERSPVSAAAFAREVEADISRILDSPSRYDHMEHGCRRLVLNRFPFNIIYRSAATSGTTEVLIVAVAHQKRRPAYWQGRLSKH